MSARWFALLWLVGCQASSDDGDPGTFVGNPGELDVSVERVSDDLSLERVTVVALDWITDDCDGNEAVIAINRTFNAVDGLFDGVTVPGGHFCGGALTLSTDDEVEVVGTTVNGTGFTAFLALDQVEVTGEFRIDGEALVVEVSLAGFDASELDILGDGVVLSSDSPESRFAAEVAELGGIELDTNNDGYGNPGSLDAAAFSADDSSGCTSVGRSATLGWIGWLLLLGLGYRRSAHPEDSWPEVDSNAGLPPS